MSMELMIILCTLTIIITIFALSVVLYHKLSLSIDRVGKQTEKLSNNTVSQIEALLALYNELQPKHGLPKTRGWAASPDFLHYLTQFVAKDSPRTVVECSSGLSTLTLASSLKKQGHGKVYSLEHDPIFAEKTRQLIQLHGLTDWATVIDAPLTETTLPGWKGKWYDTQNLPDDLVIDMLVIDGPPQSTAAQARYPAIPALKPKLSSECLVLLDDADRNDEKTIVERWLTDTPEYSAIDFLSAEKGITALKRKV